MDYLLYGIIGFLIYLWNKKSAVVASTISQIPIFTNNLPAQLAANAGASPVTLEIPSDAYGGNSVNSDGSINVPGGVMLPIPAAGDSITIDGIQYDSHGNAIPYQFLPN